MNVIYLASDHGGAVLKAQISAHLANTGYKLRDLGVNGTESVDYPDYAASLAQAMLEDVAARGILICGSGIGISIAANRFPHIRAALVNDMTSARLCRQHNDANVLALGERLTGLTTAMIASTYFCQQILKGRHQRRVDKLISPQPASF